MRILVLGICYSSPNLGDAVLSQTLARRLQQRLPEAEVVFRDLLNQKKFSTFSPLPLAEIDEARKRGKLRVTATRLGWDKEKKHEICRLSRSLAGVEETCGGDWDLVVFAGGQLFQAGFALFLDAYVQRFAQRNIPVLFNACGTGHIYSPYIRSRLTAALTAPNTRFISTRDNAALVRGRYLAGSSKEVISVSDPALWAGEVYGVERDSGSQTLGLGIMYATSLDIRKETQFWLDLIRLLEEKQVKWQFFVNGDVTDVTYARHVISQLPQEIQARQDLLAPTPLGPEELVETVARYKSIVSFRLHSHVIAASLGIPAVAIYWDDKLPFFYEKLGCPQRCKTIRHSAQEIWDTLQAAEAQGAPLDAIARQRQASEDLLVDTIRHILEGK